MTDRPMPDQPMPDQPMPDQPAVDLDCDELVELVTDFAEGALDQAAERRVVDHLALCDGCGTYLEQMRQTARDLGELPPDRLPGPARAALLAAFRGLPESS